MTAKAERLVNLTVALLATRRPLTFGELRTRMGEWDDGEPESMRRKFERDKDELRRLGVPIETVELDALGGELGYRIDPARYGLPDEELTVEQVSVLAVAHQLVQDADQLGFTQVAARAPDPVVTDVPAGVVVAPPPAEAVVLLAEALRERRVVRFAHRKPTGERADREVEPVGLFCRRGTWYLQGHDRARDEERVFRVDRIVGPVEVTGEQLPPSSSAPGRPVPTLFTPAEEVEVTVAVRDGDRWRTETRRDGATRALTRVLAATPAEVLVAPEDLAEDAARALHAVLAAHGEVAP